MDIPNEQKERAELVDNYKKESKEVVNSFLTVIVEQNKTDNPDETIRYEM